MDVLDLVNLKPLMALTCGKAEILIGLLDGPVARDHADLVGASIRELQGKFNGMCSQSDSIACQHGTFVAGILSAKRGSSIPAICPSCTLLVRPIFTEATSSNGGMPSANSEELADAILDCAHNGAHVLNISAAISLPSSKVERNLEEALDYATKRGVIIVAAAGNQGTLGSTAITRHPWVIPVVACDLQGKPMNDSNLGHTIGKRGLCAPGDGITSLNAAGQLLTLGGTSVAVPFVTGAIALLWSEFPSATATQIKLAIIQASTQRRASVVPPLLNAAAAYQILKANTRR